MAESSLPPSALRVQSALRTAGTPNTVFRLTPADLVRLTKGRVVRIT